jgi:hypothetical protein
VDLKKYAMNELLDALRLGGRLKVVGSASRRQLHPVDVDCLAAVRASRTVLTRRMRALIRRLSAIQRIRVSELKWGGDEDEPMRWTAAEFMAAEPKALAVLLSPDAKCKLDVAAFMVAEAKWVSLETLYLFTAPDGKPLSARAGETRLEEAAAAVLEGDAWTALKRRHSLNLSNGVEDARLAHVFAGSPLSALAQAVGELALILELLEGSPPFASTATALLGVAARVGRNPLVKGAAAVTKRLQEAAAAVAGGDVAAARSRVARVAKALDKVLQEEAAKLL